MSEYAQDELYKALINMMAAKQVASNALRSVTTSQDMGEALLQKALRCETILAEDLPAENQRHRVIDLAGELRQVVDANSRTIYIEQEGCVSGGYETVLRPSYSSAYNEAAMSMETFAHALNQVHWHLTATRMLETLDE